MTENPVSLSNIDPQLTELDNQESEAISNGGDNAGDTKVEAGGSAEANVHAVDQETGPSNDTTGSTKEKAKRKKQSAKPALGSTADYKRKEANRLAADRSRSRQSENRAALAEKHDRLNEANARLRDEIARLEMHDEGMSRNEGLAEAVYQQQQQQQQHHQSQQGEGSSTGGGEGLGEGTGSGSNDAMDAEAEAQAHSRTILAALMSDAEINQALGEHWINQVDGHEVDPDHSMEQASSHDTPQDTSAQFQDQSMSTDTVTEGQGPIAGPSNPSAVLGSSAEATKQDVMAVALHAEMERHIRDDMAAIKAGLAQTQHELDVLRANPDAAQIAALPTYVSPLPLNFTSKDASTLKSLIKSLSTEEAQIAHSISSLRVTASELRDSRVLEAERLQDLVSSLQVNEEDTAIVAKILHPLKSHLVESIKRLTGGAASESSSGPSLAPAIAPRRRGRPARPHAALRQQEQRKSKRQKQADREPGTRRQRSKLANQIAFGGGISGSIGTNNKASSTRKQAQADSSPGMNSIETASAQGSSQPRQQQPQHHQQEQRAPVTEQTLTDPQTSTQPDVDVELAQLAAEGANEPEAELEADVEADTEPEMTTEQIISQLTHDDQDLHDLLRSHAQAEYEAAQQTTDGSILPSQFTDQGLSTVDSSNIDPSTSGSAAGGELSIDQTLAQQIRALHEPIVFGAGPAGSCDICQRTQTTVWRKLRLPDRDLHVCNPCGMYHIKTGHIRPRELWGDGKQIRKRRKSTHPKGFNKPEPNKRSKTNTDGSQIPRNQEQSGSVNQQHPGQGSSSHPDATLDNHDQNQNQDQEEEEEGGVMGMDHQDLEDVVGHEEFRATLGMDGLGEMITAFNQHDSADDSQDVDGVFGHVQ